MICPYIEPGRVMAYQIKRTEDEEDYADIVKIMPLQCLKEECAAWQDGRCQYKK